MLVCALDSKIRILNEWSVCAAPTTAAALESSLYYRFSFSCTHTFGFVLVVYSILRFDRIRSRIASVDLTNTLASTECCSLVWV